MSKIKGVFLKAESTKIIMAIAQAVSAAGESPMYTNRKMLFV